MQSRGSSFLLAALTLTGCARALPAPEVRVDEAVPGVAWVRWEGGSGRAYVIYEADGVEARRTPSVATDGAGEIALLGLKPERDYSARIVVEDERGDSSESLPARFTSPGLDSDVPEVALLSPGTGCAAEGYVALGTMGFEEGSWALILDRDGEVVWAAEAASAVMRVHPSRDGRSLLWGTADLTRTTDIGTLVRARLDGSATEVAPAANHHHDFVERSDGTIAWLSYDFRDLDIGRGVESVAADTVLESQLVGDELLDTTEVFNLFDDYPPGVWYHTDPEAESFLPGHFDFSHGNSLMIGGDAEDSYYLNFRYLDALVKIDRATGAVRWQLGGADDEFGLAEADRFSHAHMSEIWDGGFLMFDNADETGGTSGVVEYRYDEVARTAEKVWELRHPEGAHTFIMGDAWRVDPEGCDEVLIAWSSEGRIQQVDRAGDTTWEVDVIPEPGVLLSRVALLEDLYPPEP